MTLVPYEEAQRWLAQARAAASIAWPMSVVGPAGHPIKVNHIPDHGYCVLGHGNSVRLEVAPGCTVALEDLEVSYA